MNGEESTEMGNSKINIQQCHVSNEMVWMLHEIKNRALNQKGWLCATISSKRWTIDDDNETMRKNNGKKRMWGIFCAREKIAKCLALFEKFMIYSVLFLRMVVLAPFVK